MTTQTEALKLALEALENLEEHLPGDWAFDVLESFSGKDEYRKDLARARSLIPAIKEALAQPEQEPVAWLDEYGNAFPLAAKQYSIVGKHWKPLYTTPPQRTWVGLSDEEIKPMVQKAMVYYGYKPEHSTLTSGSGFYVLVRAIEAKLKQKNGYTEDKNTRGQANG